MPVLIIALTVGLGCKNMFQEKSLVGKWREVKHYNPDKGKWEDSTDKDGYYELFENGDIGTESGKKAWLSYTLDTRANPHQLVITNKDSKLDIPWIYKFQGESLIVKMPKDPKYGVAKDFSLEPNFVITEYERK